MSDLSLGTNIIVASTAAFLKLLAPHRQPLLTTSTMSSFASAASRLVDAGRPVSHAAPPADVPSVTKATRRTATPRQTAMATMRTSSPTAHRAGPGPSTRKTETATVVSLDSTTILMTRSTSTSRSSWSASSPTSPRSMRRSLLRRRMGLLMSGDAVRVVYRRFLLVVPIDPIKLEFGDWHDVTNDAYYGCMQRDRATSQRRIDLESRGYQ